MTPDVQTTTPAAASSTHTAAAQPSTYGTSEEGNWNVYTRVDRTTSWGPFPNRTEAVQFINLVNPNLFAVNLTDLPDFFNV